MLKKLGIISAKQLAISEQVPPLFTRLPLDDKVRVGEVENSIRVELFGKQNKLLPHGLGDDLGQIHPGPAPLEDSFHI